MTLINSLKKCLVSLGLFLCFLGGQENCDIEVVVVVVIVVVAGGIHFYRVGLIYIAIGKILNT